MKVQIIGGSGTGKSTLAKFISEKENIKWIDTDRYLWKDESFTENHPIEKRKEMYEIDMEFDRDYVVSGSIFSWYPNGFTNRDLFVFLFLDEEIRMERLRKREIKRNNPKEAWLDEDGNITNEFLEWCKTYLKEKDKTMIGTYAAQSYEMELSKSPILKLDSSQSLEELYLAIKEAFQGEREGGA
ncbi:Adenylate kinase [Psychrobacillus sp. OK028]|uniref:AAA family ATPase n=1 Tax=Psychrobacillus sp. OK028 TaxID=1884359 RepID=UPI0008829F77|nr:AAA family ATPase [Psychrobacillus sp. OK028]SDM89306.1 Adenylate kinase [Psychrobacillus sp. OK028]